ncbi:MAG: DUF47 family protein [Alphaproteobacteria bacterium]|nr:DUF47 family protein [Alphaproteobacteria bacterium]
MVDILPFKRTGLLISEIDDYFDKVSEAAMIVQRTVLHYLDHGPDEELAKRVDQIRAVEDRADEVRRNIANVMYTEMLMPDTRGDVLSLLNQVDIALDNCVHLVLGLAMERPELPDLFHDGFRKMLAEVDAAAQVMVSGARAYFTEPQTVRNYVHKINFHNQEATAIGLQGGSLIFDSDLPLDRKLQLRDWLIKVRDLASTADDIGDQLAILAVKRSV